MPWTDSCNSENNVFAVNENTIAHEIRDRVLVVCEAMNRRPPQAIEAIANSSRFNRSGIGSSGFVERVKKVAFLLGQASYLDSC